MKVLSIKFFLKLSTDHESERETRCVSKEVSSDIIRLLLSQKLFKDHVVSYNSTGGRVDVVKTGLLPAG